MNAENEMIYVETDEVEEKKEPRALAILSLVFGIASILLCGPLGIIFGGLAERFAAYVLSRIEESISTRLAAAGQITGVVGLAISLTVTALGVLVAIFAVWIILNVMSGKALLY